MKKLIYGCLLATLAMNPLLAQEVVDKKNNETQELTEILEPAEGYKFQSLRFGFPAIYNKKESNMKNYFYGASLFGELEKNTNLIGLYTDFQTDFADGCDLGGFAFALGHGFENVSGVSCVLLWSENTELTGLAFSGMGHDITEINGLEFAGMLNINTEANGAVFSAFGNNHEVLNGIAFGGFFNGFYLNENQMKEVGDINVLNNALEMNGLALAGIYNMYRDGNGVALSLMNKFDYLNGVNFGFLNVADVNAIGLQFGGVNTAMSSDVCLQSGLMNVSNDAYGTAQFGLWNLIGGTGSTKTIQFGILNNSSGETVQIGLLNFSEKGFLKFFPFVNF
ncbi:hypothetical protein AAEX28_05955 [Lentisphaerota bacterium WC36G]|nr:hypothetical protein LJT99_08815 [Lentisphaerae bacterium WC36]